MKTDEIKALLFTLISDIAPEADPASLDPAEPIRDQVDLDSVDFLNLIVKLCQRLAIDIPESDYAKLTTINDCLAYLSERTGR